MWRAALAGLACAATVFGATVTHAAHPLISEDTGTQGAGHAELELGASFVLVDGGHVFEFDPQLSYGLRDDFDAIVRPSLFHVNGPPADQAGRRGGFGPTALDAKWRIASWDAIFAGTRFGVDLPTSSRGLGPQRAGWHALAMVTYDRSGTLATANLAYTRLSGEDPQLRRNVWRMSAAVVRNVREDLRLLIDLATSRPEERELATWRAVALVGAIARIPPGIDVDVGYQFRLNDAGPSNMWLAGMTLRW